MLSDRSVLPYSGRLAGTWTWLWCGLVFVRFRCGGEVMDLPSAGGIVLTCLWCRCCSYVLRPVDWFGLACYFVVYDVLLSVVVGRVCIYILIILCVVGHCAAFRVLGAPPVFLRHVSSPVEGLICCRWSFDAMESSGDFSLACVGSGCGLISIGTSTGAHVGSSVVGVWWLSFVRVWGGAFEVPSDMFCWVQCLGVVASCMW